MQKATSDRSILAKKIQYCSISCVFLSFCACHRHKWIDGGRAGQGHSWIWRDKSSCDRNEECGVLKGLASSLEVCFHLFRERERKREGSGWVCAANLQVNKLVGLLGSTSKVIMDGNTQGALKCRCQALRFPLVFLFLNVLRTWGGESAETYLVCGPSLCLTLVLVLSNSHADRHISGIAEGKIYLFNINSMCHVFIFSLQKDQ